MQNTGNVEIEIITASGGSPSDEIKFFLLDSDGNVLSSAPFKQDLGEGVVTLSNGVTVAHIKPGAIFSSSNIAIPVPLNAPDKVFIKLDISKVHAHLNQDTHTQISGLSATREISLIDTSYYGEITLVTPLTSRGNEDITITGRAINRSTSQPLSLTALNLIIAVGGFERKNSVWTDVSGVFSYKFKPQANECGIYKVCAVHPDLLDRPEQAQFVINRLHLAPEQINLNIPRNYEQTVNIRVSAGEGTKVNNLHLVYQAVDQPDGKLADGVHLTLEPAITALESFDSTNLSFKLWADNNAADRGTIVLKVKSDEAIADSWGTITLNTQSSAATPILYFSPNYVETGVKFDQAATETVTLENKGFTELRDAKLALVIDSDDPAAAPAPAWVRLNVVSELGSIAVGAKKEAVISFVPTQVTAAEGLHRFRLRVTSANYPLTDIFLYVTVTQSGIGNILFKASDIFTGTPDAGGQAIQGLSAASISIQNDLIPSIQETKFSDSAGEALFTGLVSGSYKFWVTADKHRQQTGRIWVKPGITVTEEVFLSYDLVTVEWSVRETTIQDKYEIILNATYETDVPAAVIVAEPKSFSLPAMQPGDVFNAEVRFTNYGLIRADNIALTLPIDDQYFDYSALAAIPTSLSAKQSITVPVRLVCKKSLSPPGIASGAGSSAVVAGSKALAVGSSAEATANAGATGAGCVTYTNCIYLGYTYVCANGVWQRQEEYACFTGVEGECEEGGAVLYDGIASGDIWVPGAGATSGSMASPTPIALEDSLCAGQERFCAVDDECCRAPQNQEIKSLVSLIGRGYEDDVTDMSIKAPGFQVNVMRRYYDNAWHLDSDSQNLEIVYGPDGVSIESIKKDAVLYTKSDTQWNVYTFGNKRFIFVKEGGGFRWQNKSGKWAEYDTKGRLLYYGNKNNVKVTLIYEPGENGKLIGLKDNNGRQVLWYEYNQDGKLSIVRDHTGREVKYSYDVSVGLVQVVDVSGNVTLFYYDLAGRLIREREAGGLVKDIAYTTFKHVKSVTYGNSSSVSFDYAYNAGKQEYYARVLFTSGKTIERWYDRLGRRIRIVINGQETERAIYSGRNKTVIDAAGNQTLQEYDEWGNLIKKTNPDGTSVSYEYDLNFNQLIKKTDPKGVVTKYEYEGNGNLTKLVQDYMGELENTTIYTYDTNGNQTSVTDPLGHKTTYEYDANENLIKITDPLGNSTIYTYDNRANRLNEQDANFNTTTYSYDLMDRLIGITDAVGNNTMYTYDIDGNIISVTDANNNTRKFVYDILNRLIQEIGPFGNIASYTYDSQNNRISSSDANGNTTFYAYDILGRKIKITDALGNESNFTYDSNGNLASIIDARGNVTKYRYDVFNRVIQKNYSDGAIHTYTYDVVGNNISEKDPNGNTTTFTYDHLNRLVTKTFQDGSTSNYSYNVLGKMLSGTNADSNLSYSYDVLGRVLQMSLNGRTVVYSYDAVGNRVKMTTPEGEIIQYSYNKLNQMLQIKLPNGKSIDYSYDSLKRIKRKDYSGGNYSTYIFDKADRLAQIKHFKNDSSEIYSQINNFDNVGNIISKITGLETTNYNYDKLYQLISVTHSSSPSENYTYDPVGNRLSSVGYNDWSYNNRDQLIGYDGVSFTYDSNGNTLSKTDMAGTTRYVYDYENRLTKIYFSDGNQATYKYDILGRRIEKNVNGNINKYLYDGNYLIAEYDSIQNLTRSYFYGYADLNPSILVENNKVYYFLNDHLNAPQKITDENGNIVWEANYHSFGEANVVSEEVNNNFRFPGQYLDQESMLYYNYFRYYNATAGRYLTEDPIDFNYGGSYLYIYARNNPILNGDPLGLFNVIPAYGNCCGPDKEHSCNKSSNTIDSMDSCCKQHDVCLDSNLDLPNILIAPCDPRRVRCDYNLLSCVKALPDNPKCWPQPAPNSKAARSYRNKIYLAFPVCKWFLIMPSPDEIIWPFIL